MTNNIIFHYDRKSFLEFSNQNLLTDDYIVDEDDMDYSFLIDKEIVLDENGKVKINKPLDIENKTVLSIDHVISGRGPFDAWKSNMQKMIRRGKTKETLKSIQETSLCGGLFLSNIINRLCKVIVSEDIGPAEPRMARECYVLLKEYEIEKKKNVDINNDKDFRNKLFLLGKKLSLSRKSRICDNIIHAIGRIEYDEEMDFDKEFKIFRGYVEKNDIENSIMYLFLLIDISNNKKIKVKLTTSDIENVNIKDCLKNKRKQIYKVWRYILCESLKQHVDLSDIGCNLLNIYNLSVSGENVLLIVNAILNLIFYKKGLLDLNYLPKITLNDDESWDAIKKNNNIWIDDVSYDKHTKIGREIGRGRYFFWRYGAKIANKNNLLSKLDNKYYNKAVKNVLE
jgi:hypothetical protein